MLFAVALLLAGALVIPVQRVWRRFVCPNGNTRFLPPAVGRVIVVLAFGSVELQLVGCDGDLYATAAEMLLMRRQMKRLREERRALCVIIHKAVDRLIPEDLERLFPSRSHELVAKSKR